MRLRLALLLVLAVHTVAGETSLNSSTAAPSSVTSCQQLGLVSINVRGAPNAFCAPTNTCNTNYVGSCPGENAVDTKGGKLVGGSCCAALESTGDVGCVSLALVQSGAFQCINHAGAREVSRIVDITTATPPPTTAAPATASPTTTAPTDGSRGTTSDPVDSSTTPIPKPDTRTTSTPTTAPTTSSPTTTPKPRLSSSSSSAAGSASGVVEPEAGVDPSIPVFVPATPSRPVAATAAPTVPPGALETLAPIPDSTDFLLGAGASPSASTTTSTTRPNTKPLSAPGSSSSTSTGNTDTPALNENVGLALVLGTVGSVAVVLGAFMLRRRRGTTSSAASSRPTSATEKLASPDLPALTLDGDDDFFEDLQFRQTDAFSPIFVQPAHSYVESNSPNNDRESYLL